MLPSHQQDPSLFKIILVGLIGNIVEWYDFAVYGYFASIIGQLFFPSSDAAVSLIASFGAFAAGFLMRPLGGLLFGRIGDQVGREKAMSISVVAMAVPTLLMALLPTYDSVGMLAPIILVLLRMIQGLSVGGEYTSSLVFLAERAPKNRRAFTAVWGNWGAAAGILLGSGVGWLSASIMSDADLVAWGWRIPFAVGGLVAMTGWLIRRSIPVAAHKERSESPVKEVFGRYGWTVMRITLMNIGPNVVFYTAFVYAVTYIRKIDQLPESMALELNTLAMLFMLLILPFGAWCSDRFGRKRLLVPLLSILLLLAYPLFGLIHSTDPSDILQGELAFAFIVAMVGGSMVAFNVELMPMPIRCTGLAFAYNLSAGLFGGTTPLIAAWLIHASDNPIAPVFWVLTGASISLLTLVFFIKDPALETI
ncbi:MAG: MFS transporter [Gammaproteobacteria bacterium]|nr:MFS transporter [Gammaproteobacteria bacterium]